MADTHVLVPMKLDALTLNTVASLATPFNRFEMNYRNLWDFKSPEPEPFDSSTAKPPTAGIYLHWTLPQALRHGEHADEETKFHYVPNRWLVVRTQAGVAANQAVKAWLIESDYQDPHAGSSAYINPSGMTAGGSVSLTKIGRSRLLSVVESLDSQANPFLQAVGPGNVYFSSFEPGLTNVLAFHDEVTDNDSKAIDKASFTYSVVGWYSDAEHDPLYKTTWARQPAEKPRPGDKPDPDADKKNAFANSDLPWRVFGADANLPTQTLVHAIAPDVTWDRSAPNLPAKSYPAKIPCTVQVAFGNTAIDALSGIVALDQPNQTEADMLEAFQYGLLDQFDQPGASEALNMAIRQHWYGASSGGTRWTIVPVERAGDTAPPTPPPDVSPELKAALATLNAAQHELDRQQRILESMQSVLFGLWWRYRWLGRNTLDDPLNDWFGGQLALQAGDGSTPTDPTGTDPSKEPWYAWKVNAQQNLVDQLSAGVTGQVKKLAGERNLDADHRTYGDLGQTLDLKAANMPQYFLANDPVVLVTGLGRATNFNPDEGVLCRLPSQAVAGFKIGDTPYTAASLGGRIPPLADPKALLPDGLQALHTESFFLAPKLFAQDILNSTSEAAITSVKTAIAALLQPAPGAQFPGEPYTYECWEQPWVPLLLDWEVIVLRDPAYTAEKGQPTPTFHPDNWTFDGTDYKWTGPTTADGTNFSEVSSGTMTLRGRTFVTPQVVVSLAKQLDQYVQTHQFRDPNLEQYLKDLDKFVNGISGQDVLSQRLGGLLGMMVQQGQTQTVQPTGPIAKLLGPTQHGIPRPYMGDEVEYAPANWDFAPFGGSFYLINRLTVIDAFGRTIDLLLANYSTFDGDKAHVDARYFYPITGRGLRASTAKLPAKNQGQSQRPTERMIQMAPSLAQPSQLRFRLVSNDGTNRDVDEVATANPVCGWIVPNHLNRSLAIYAPDGTAWGELYLSAHVGGTFEPAWQPDPTSAHPIDSVKDIPNQYVSGMLQAIWDRNDNGAAFSDLLAVVDQTLWGVNPRGDKNDHDLEVLVGRPLAIVRAELSLRGSGLPTLSQDWKNLFVKSSIDADDSSKPAQLAAFDGDISLPTWPVRLGSQALRDDGLVGYFADIPKSPDHPDGPDDTYKAFTTVWLPPSPKTTYLQMIAPSNYPKVCLVNDGVSQPDPVHRQVCHLTMLVDPRGSIHAFSGLLPVVTLSVPSEFVAPALSTISYLFRAGPFLTVPEAVRVPRPSETKGKWAWFDHVLQEVAPLTPADGNVSISTTPPLIKEGWLKFTPNPPTPRGHE